MNGLIYRTLFYVNIYGSYKLSKNSPFFWPTLYYMASVCPPTKFDVNIFTGDQDMAEKQNPRWRLPPSWISNKCYSEPPVVLVWPMHSTANLVYIGQELAEIHLWQSSAISSFVPLDSLYLP